MAIPPSPTPVPFLRMCITLSAVSSCKSRYKLSSPATHANFPSSVYTYTPAIAYILILLPLTYVQWPYHPKWPSHTSPSPLPYSQSAVLVLSKVIYFTYLSLVPTVLFPPKLFPDLQKQLLSPFLAVVTLTSPSTHHPQHSPSSPYNPFVSHILPFIILFPFNTLPTLYSSPSIFPYTIIIHSYHPHHNSSVLYLNSHAFLYLPLQPLNSPIPYVSPFFWLPLFAYFSPVPGFHHPHSPPASPLIMAPYLRPWVPWYINVSARRETIVFLPFIIRIKMLPLIQLREKLEWKYLLFI